MFIRKDIVKILMVETEVLNEEEAKKINFRIELATQIEKGYIKWNYNQRGGKIFWK